MDLTDHERRLILAGLFELTITHAEDDDKRKEIKALARKARRRPGGDVLRARLISVSRSLGWWMALGMPSPRIRRRFGTRLFSTGIRGRFLRRCRRRRLLRVIHRYQLLCS
jgi:hypothetical protein